MGAYWTREVRAFWIKKRGAYWLCAPIGSSVTIIPCPSHTPTHPLNHVGFSTLPATSRPHPHPSHHPLAVKLTHPPTQPCRFLHLTCQEPPSPTPFPSSPGPQAHSHPPTHSTVSVSPPYLPRAAGFHLAQDNVGHGFVLLVLPREQGRVLHPQVCIRVRQRVPQQRHRVG